MGVYKMEKRQEFYDLLCQMHIINTETEASARQKYQIIQKWLLENTPTRLFRYFSNAERNIDALANNEVWGSRIDTFNDPYECVPCFDAQWLLDAIDHDVLTQQSKQIISQLKSNNFKMNAASLTSTEDLQRLADNMQQYSEEQIMQGLTFAEQQLKGYIGDHVYEFMSEAYAQIHVAELYRHIACFTENMDSTLMWGHYASSHQGFCAEYDFSSVLEPCTENCSDIRFCSNFMLNHSIAPVYYSKGRVDATSFLSTVIQHNLMTQVNIPMQPLQDLFVATKCLLVKSEDWEYEKEWRLLSQPSEINEKYKVITHLKPKAIYIGVKTAKEQAEKIYTICKQQNIPCYKMLQSYVTSDFSLDHILYEEFAATYYTQNK